MELALYCPVYGYYEKERDTIGRTGDYFTSVSVGPLFGELLAFQFTCWLSETAAGRHVNIYRIVEAGAHAGELARDILSWIRRQRPDLWERVHYSIIEPSPRRQQWQECHLAELAGRVRWIKTPSELTTQVDNQEGFGGIIFSNEFFDAFPVHRLSWDARRSSWFEWGVARKEDQFRWVRIALRDVPFIHFGEWSLSEELLAALPDGFTVEVSPMAEEWWKEAAGLLTWGKLLTADYGLASDEILTAGCNGGTLRAYRQHCVHADVLTNPGLQDMTAHINFSALRAAGESRGLETEQFVTQRQFLTSIAAQAWKEGARFGEWTAKHARQFQTLTHPEHLGARFRILQQGRAGIISPDDKSD